MRSEILASSCHIKDLDDQLSHTQELLYDLVVQENARSECQSISPDRSGTPRTGHIVAPERGERPHPRTQDKKHFCRKQFQLREISFRRTCHMGLQIQGQQQPKPIPKGHHQQGESVSSGRLRRNILKWKRKGKAKGSRYVGIWNLAALQHFPNVKHDSSQ